MKQRDILFVIKMRNAARDALRELGKQFKDTAAQAEGMRRQTDAAGQSKKRMGDEAERAGKKAKDGFSGVGERLRDIARGSALAAGAMRSVAAAGAGFLAGFTIVGAIREFGEIQKAMGFVRAELQATEADYLSMQDAARKTAVEFGTSAGESTRAMAIFADEGFTAANSVRAIRDATMLAKITNTDLATSTEFLTRTMRVFKVDASQTGQAVDILAQIGVDTTMSLQDLAGILRIVGPTAAAAGLNFNEAASAAGALNQAGYAGRRAGAALETALQSLINPSAEVRENLFKIGLTARDIDPRIKGLAGSLATLRAKGLTGAKATQVFGEGGQALSSLASGSFGGLLANTQQAGGAAQSYYKKVSDNIIDDFKKLGSAISESMLQAISAVGPLIRDFLQTVTGIVRVFNGTADAADKNYASWVAWADAIKMVSIAFAGLALVSVIAQVGALGGAILTAAKAFTVFIATMHPIGFAITMLGLVAAALYGLRDATFEVGGEVVRLGDVFRGLWAIVKQVATFIWEALKSVYQAFTSNGDNIKGFWMWLFTEELPRGAKQLANLVIGTFVAIGQTIATILDNVRQQWEMFIEAIQRAMRGDFGGAWGALKQAAAAPFQLGDLPQKWGEAYAKDYVGGLWTGLKSGVQWIAKQAPALNLPGAISGNQPTTKTTGTIGGGAATPTGNLGDPQALEQLKALHAQLQPYTAALYDAAKAEETLRKFRLLSADEQKKLRDMGFDPEVLRQRIEWRKQEADVTNQVVQKLKDEQALVGKIGREKEEAAVRQQYLRELEKQGVQDVTRRLNEQMEAWRALQREKDRVNNDPMHGARSALEEYAERARNVSASVKDAMSTSLSAMEDMFVQFFMKGKLDWKQFAMIVIQEIIKIQVRALMAKAVLMAIGMMSGTPDAGSLAGTAMVPDGGGGMVPHLHSGGIVGEKARMAKRIPMSVFANAKRYHTGGLAGGEVPAILKKGEAVMPTVRLPNGNLGVQAADGGGGNVTNHVEVHVTVQGGGDTDAATTGTEIGKTVVAIVDSRLNEWAQRESRSGGMLNRNGING